MNSRKARLKAASYPWICLSIADCCRRQPRRASLHAPSTLTTRRWSDTHYVRKYGFEQPPNSVSLNPCPCKLMRLIVHTCTWILRLPPSVHCATRAGQRHLPPRPTSNSIASRCGEWRQRQDLQVRDVKLSKAEVCPVILLRFLKNSVRVLVEV